MKEFKGQPGLQTCWNGRNLRHVEVNANNIEKGERGARVQWQNAVGRGGAGFCQSTDRAIVFVCAQGICAERGTVFLLLAGRWPPNIC